MKNPILSVSFAALLGVLPATIARGALVTFSGAYSNGQNSIPSTYQPLMTDSYVGPDATTDGANLGVTITWAGFSTSNPDANNGVFDHTTGNVANRKGVVGYDNGNADISMTFDAAVAIPTFYFSNFSGSGTGTYTMRFRGYTNAGDTTPAVDVSRVYTQTTGPNNGGYQWIAENGLGNTPIHQLVISGDSYKQLDDFTINLAPEPASIAILAPLFLITLRRHRKA